MHLDEALANAICDMDDIAFGEGLGCETLERSEAWDKLVAVSERIAKRTTNAKECKKIRESELELDGPRD